MSKRGYPEGKPRLYAKEKFDMLEGRLKHEVIGPKTEQFAAITFPGAPAHVFHGFTSFTMRPSEDTADAGNSFHEIGLYQVEAGPAGKPAPNPDPEADHNNWAVLADGDLVRQMLGRAATMKEGAWKTALDDQIAVGLANLRLHQEKMARQLVSSLKAAGHSAEEVKKLAQALVPAELGGNWSLLWSFTSFSRGESQFAKTLMPYVTELAETAESERWVRWRSLVLADIRAKKDNIARVPGKKGAPYALIRSEQKLQSGYELALRSGHDATWFQCIYAESTESIADEDLLTRVAYPS